MCGGVIRDTGAVQIHPESFLMGMKIIPNTAGGISLYRDLNSLQRCFQNRLGRRRRRKVELIVARLLSSMKQGDIMNTV